MTHPNHPLFLAGNPRVDDSGYEEGAGRESDRPLFSFRVRATTRISP